MKITVKAAHHVVHTYFSRVGILDGLVQHLHEVKPKVGKRALKLLENPNDKYDSCVFDPLHPLCSPEERRILRACVNGAYRQRTVRGSLSFTVHPTLTIGALKSLLKPLPWIAKENLVLVPHKERPLEDDNSTLDECNVKDRDLLLACREGSFPLTVLSGRSHREYVIPISGCFETLGQLKEKIFKEVPCYPKDQKLIYQHKLIRKKYETRLVELGIVRDVPEGLRRIQLYWYPGDEEPVTEKVTKLSWVGYD